MQNDHTSTVASLDLARLAAYVAVAPGSGSGLAERVCVLHVIETKLITGIWALRLQ